MSIVNFVDQTQYYIALYSNTKHASGAPSVRTRDNITFNFLFYNSPFSSNTDAVTIAVVTIVVTTHCNNNCCYNDNCRSAQKRTRQYFYHRVNAVLSLQQFREENTMYHHIVLPCVKGGTRQGNNNVVTI